MLTSSGSLSATNLLLHFLQAMEIHLGEHWIFFSSKSSFWTLFRYNMFGGLTAEPIYWTIFLYSPIGDEIQF
jgi:hypothetical protein